MAQCRDVDASCGAVADGFAYACMHVQQLTIWIAIGLAVGFIARCLVKGPRPFGLLYDLLLGLAGIFLIGFVFTTIGVKPAEWAYLSLDLDAAVSIWIEVTLAGLIGAFFLQGVVRLVCAIKC